MEDMTYLLIGVGCFVAAVLAVFVIENPGILVSIGSVIIAFFGVIRLYKRDMKEQIQEHEKLVNQVEIIKNDRINCTNGHTKREDAINKQFEIIFFKLDEIPNRIMDQLQTMQTKNDIRFDKLTERIDKFKDK